MTKKKITLWSWLTKQDTKTEFLCPPGHTVTNEELAEELARQAQNNGLPARVELYEVNWDDTDTKQDRVLIRYTGSDTATDIIQYLVGVDNMGSFAYVEEKIYLEPPHLPSLPRKKKELGSEPQEPSSNGITLLLLAVLGILGIGLAIGSGGEGLDSLCCGLPGLLSLIGLFYVNHDGKLQVKKWQHALKEWREDKAWNDAAEREEKAWLRAWENWYSDTLKVAYQAKRDDVFGRFTLAMSSTIDQVLQRLFIDQEAELRRSTEREQTEKEIAAEMERRQKEMFQ